MKQLIIFLALFVITPAKSLEVIIFDKKIELDDRCLLIAGVKKVDLKPTLHCYYDEATTLEVFLSHECPKDYLDNALNEEGEKLAKDIVSNKVRYLEYHLKDRNNGSPLFARLIHDEDNCLIASGKSLTLLKKLTKDLWPK